MVKTIAPSTQTGRNCSGPVRKMSTSMTTRPSRGAPTGCCHRRFLALQSELGCRPRHAQEHRRCHRLFRRFLESPLEGWAGEFRLPMLRTSEMRCIVAFVSSKKGKAEEYDFPVKICLRKEAILW